MNSNRIEVKTKIRQHILDCITDEYGDKYPDYKAACKKMQAEFNRAANYSANIQRIPNGRLRFADYMQGLPFSFEYYYCDIITFLLTLDLDNIKAKISTNDKVETLYYNLIYREMMNVK